MAARTYAKADRATAEHEGAHAVIAVMYGLAVGRITIAPPKAQATDAAGLVEAWVSPQAERWPVPLRPGAELDMAAAGFAWEAMQAARRRRTDLSGLRWDLTHAWHHAGGDRRRWTRRHFVGAAVRVALVLRRPHVDAAVREVADALEARKSGTIYGTTVARICQRRGLLPRPRPMTPRQVSGLIRVNPDGTGARWGQDAAHPDRGSSPWPTTGRSSPAAPAAT